jgi:hypothetical protein
MHLLSVTKQDVKKGNNNFCGVREKLEVFNYNKRLSLSLILHIKNVILLMLKVRYNNKSYF